MFEGEFLYGDKRNGKLYDYDGELVNINIENLGHCEIRHIRTRSRQRGRGAKILERGREKKY